MDETTALVPAQYATTVVVFQQAAENTTLIPAQPAEILNRANEVAARIQSIRRGLTDQFFELGDLLAEVKREKYYQTAYGHATFGQWVTDSGLDMSERQAYYLIEIVETAAKLGIDRESLKASRISKLKEIFTLDSVTQGDQIKALVEDSGGDSPLSLEEVRSQVRRLKAAAGEAATTFLNIKLLLEDKENIIDPAIETARREHGDTVGEGDEPTDISVGKALTLICADYNAAPHEEPITIDVPAEGAEA